MVNCVSLLFKLQPIHVIFNYGLIAEDKVICKSLAINLSFR